MSVEFSIADIGQRIDDALTKCAWKAFDAGTGFHRDEIVDLVLEGLPDGYLLPHPPELTTRQALTIMVQIYVDGELGKG